MITIKGRGYPLTIYGSESQLDIRFNDTDVATVSANGTTCDWALSGTVRADSIIATTTLSGGTQTYAYTKTEAKGMSATNLCATNAIYGVTVSATNLCGTNVYATNITATAITGVNKVYAIQVTATNMSATGAIYAAGVSATSLCGTNVYATNITATTVTGVNSVYAITVTATNMSGTNVYATNITATTVTGVNSVYAITVTATNMSATGAVYGAALSGTSLTLPVTGFIMTVGTTGVTIPAASGDGGTAGMFGWTAEGGGWLYICTQANTWVRVALSGWK